jgi:GntR family transcriptional regulator, sialic acid-inducible nan operon repressor
VRTTANAPIRRRKLYEEVMVRLEEMIQDGQLGVGDFLPSEREIMQQFGVGRPAVREALFALQRMGLVVVGTGERPRVSAPTPKTLLSELAGSARLLLSKPDGTRHFQRARALFECGLAEEAARVATEDDVRELKEALDLNEAALGDPTRFVRTDVQFHFVIALISRNPIYTALHEAIVEWLADQRSVVLRHQGVDHVAFRSHQLIFDAIAAHDSDKARETMREHLREISELYWKREDGGA